GRHRDGRLGAVVSDLAVCAYALVALVALLLLRIPVAVALGGVSFVGLWVLVGIDAAFGIFKSIPYDFVAHWSLSSVPMFLLMGYICYHARLTDGLFELARVWLARLPGRSEEHTSELQSRENLVC